MKAAITGGAGFIGSHLADYLLDHGHDVVALDDLSTGSLSNLETALWHPRFTFVAGSILDERVVEDVISECDTVFHLAAAVGVRRILDQPVKSRRTNLHGTETVLACVARHGCRFVLTSTSEVYGKNTADRLREDDDRILGSTLKSRWSYATAKALDEFVTYCHWQQHGLPTVIVRPFNVVGPRQTGRYGMVVPSFVDQALAGAPLTIYGDGTQRRCFCAVNDIVPAMVDLIEQPRAYCEVVNLGGTEETTIEDLARRIRQLAGSRSELVYVPYTTAYGAGYEDMRRRVPDTTLARELIGFVPTTGLDTMIRAVLRERATAAVRFGAIEAGTTSEDGL